MSLEIQFQCPSCGAKRLVASSLVGRRARCPNCDELVKVSAESTVDVKSSQEERPAGTETVSGFIPLTEEMLQEADEEEEDSSSTLMIDDEEPPIDDIDDYLEEEEPSDDDAAVSFGSSQRAGEAEMDMTPMVDVTFLLLIFFIVTAAFALQRSFPVPPQKQEDPSTQSQTIEDIEDDPDYVIVRVDAFNTYHVYAAVLEEETEVPSEHELLVKLREARRGNSDGKIPSRMIVIANAEARYEKVVTALDHGTEVGMEEVKLVTVEEDE